ncbi:MAG: hypothetical protein LBJ61_02390 [Deltaproteobacteria bacterium]|jgi:hypothetical protein|nr:hypothetical protein [Deltaproteobacteria bacterium]
MNLSMLLFITVGIPLILLTLGFVLICLKWLWSKDQRANQAKLLETAARIDGNLTKLEVRLTALEDILLQPGATKRPGPGGAINP